ncbi:MAG: hypothetical protein PVJ86_07400 [Phycisphaerales bacterium]
MKNTMMTTIVVSIILAPSVPAFGHFAITYYDNYNYDTGQWDAWQSDATPLDAWDDKYAPIDPGKTEFTDHAFTSIATFDLRGGLFSKDGHAAGGEDWNPLRSIGDEESGQSAHHVFAAVFRGLIYLEEGDVFSVASDDDVYVFLGSKTAWGQEVLSVPHISFFGTDSTVVTAAQAGLHMMTVKFIERRNQHSGIEITLNGEHLQNAKAYIDIKPGSCPNPLNLNSKGVLPVAILGSEGFDVTTIDPDSILLEGVAPIRSSYEDVSTPVSEDECACTTEGPDGFLDLTLKFKTQEIVAAIGEVSDGDLLSLTLTGEDISGVSIEGTDCVVVIDNTKPIITSVVRDGVTEGQPEIVTGPSPGGLQEGSHAFMDRPLDEFDTRNYHWENIPSELAGADYVMTYNEDCKPAYPYAYLVSYSVTLGRAAKLYIFVDQRYSAFAWLTDGTSGAVFEDTGLDIDLNEVGGTGLLRPFYVYGAEVPAGTYILGPSCDTFGSRNFYSIAAAK